MEKDCLSCVLENGTFFRNVFPYSKYEYECVDDVNKIELGTLILYRACNILECSIVDSVRFQYIIPPKLCKRVFIVPHPHSHYLFLMLAFVVCWFLSMLLCFGVDRGIVEMRRARHTTITRWAANILEKSRKEKIPSTSQIVERV